MTTKNPLETYSVKDDAKRGGACLFVAIVLIALAGVGLYYIGSIL